MDLESKRSALGSVEDKNGEIDTKMKGNGKCDGESVDGKSMDEIKVEGTVGKTGSSPPPAATKGRGLRKWRRIRRESGKETNSSLDSNRKRGSIALPVAIKQRSEGSSSSTNAVSNAMRNALDHSPLYVDLSLGRGPDFAARADSETSEDRNSRSSTAASAPRVNHELPVVGLSGKNLGILVQPGDKQEKGRSVTNKKARGIKIKKENSISSVESDSRSANFVFTQVANSMTSNGRQSGRSENYEEDYSDDAQNGDRRLNEEARTAFSKNEADYEDVSHEDLAAANSWDVKEEKVDDHVGSGVRDALVESIMPLHLAQEALKREVEKLRDVGKEDTLFSDDSVQPSGSTFVYPQGNDPRSFEEVWFIHELKDAKISELESTLNLDDVKTEHEELLKQRIAAELEHLVISKTIQDLKVGHVDRINLTVQQKNVAEPVHLEDAGETREDAWKLRKTVCRYASWFMIQSVLLLVVVYLFVSRFSSRNMEVIPT